MALPRVLPVSVHLEFLLPDTQQFVERRGGGKRPKISGGWKTGLVWVTGGKLILSLHCL